MRIISGKWRGKKIYSPPDDVTRPILDRTKESLFNLLIHGIGFSLEGKCILDLFAGTGSLGLEALSQGGANVTFVENHSLSILKKNTTELPAVTIIPHDVLSVCLRQSYDLIFMDPPYGQEISQKSLQRIHQQGWLSAGGVIVIKIGVDKPLSPLSFSMIKEKNYGKTKLLFLRHL